MGRLARRSDSSEESSSLTSSTSYDSASNLKRKTSSTGLLDRKRKPSSNSSTNTEARLSRSRKNQVNVDRVSQRRTLSEPRLPSRKTSLYYGAYSEAYYEQNDQSFKRAGSDFHNYDPSTSHEGPRECPLSNDFKVGNWFLDLCLAVLLFICTRKPLSNLFSDRKSGASKTPAKMLVTVTVLGSIQGVRVLVRYDATVKEAIQAALDAYEKQDRLPRQGCKVEAYELHYSEFCLQGLDPQDLIKNSGTRNFVLCPKPQQQQQQGTCSPRDAKVVKPWWSVVGL